MKAFISSITIFTALLVLAAPTFATERLKFPNPPTRQDDALWSEALSFWERRGQVQDARNALASFQTLAARHPDQIEPELWLCRIYFFLGIHETNFKKRTPILQKSIDHCKRALTMDPENCFAMYWLGSAKACTFEIDSVLPQIEKFRKSAQKFLTGRELPVPDENNPIWKSAMEHWDARANLDRARSAVDLWEKVAEKNPESFEAWAWLARGYYWLGENAKNEEEAEKLHYRGYEFGLKAVELRPRNPGANLWSASNLARYAQRGSIIRKGRLSRKIFNHLQIVNQEEPDYYYGSLSRFLAFSLADAGVVTRKLLILFGFEPEKIVQIIQISLAREPNYFDTHIAMAELAIAMGNNELAREHLEFVLNNPPESFPKAIPENRLSKKKAQMLLKKIKNH